MEKEIKMFGGRGFTPAEQEQINLIASDVFVSKIKDLGLGEQKSRDLQEDFIYLRKIRKNSQDIWVYIKRSMIWAMFSISGYLLFEGIKIWLKQEVGK